MALARHNQAILDTAGNVVHGASVEVRNETTGLLPQLYSDRAGTVAIGNPFTAADGADAGFHVIGGAYKITATSGALTRIWRYVAIGTNAETDSSQFDGFKTTGFTINTSGSDQMNISGGTQNVVIFNGVGNSKTAAIHLNPGSGTLATDTVAEFVLQRTADQAFGGNYGRVSFSALGSGSGNIDTLHAEYGGSVTPVRFDFGIGIENPASTFASYNFMSLGYASGGSESSQLGAVWFGNDLQTAQRNQISLVRAAIGSAGTRDSHAILQEGKANDGAERAVWWRQYVDVTSNAGASSFVWERNLNGAGWTGVLSLTSAGSLSPTTSDALALGTTSLMWSDLFLASGGVINWNNGDVTLTHSADALTLGGGNLGVGTTPSVLIHSLLNDTATTPQHRIEQSGTGDAALNFLLTGGQNWSIGIDNSDSDKFKISAASALGSSDFLTITSTGLVGINRTAPNYLFQINASSGSHALMQFTNATTGVGATKGAYFGITDGSTDFRLACLETTNAMLFLVNAAATTAMQINPSGGVTIGAATDAGATNLLGTGSIKSNSATSGVGYASGAGGAVTQATDKSTGVTLNKVTGQITTNNAALNAGAEVGFTVTNSTVAATDAILLNVASGATANSYQMAVDAVAAGSFRISLTNVSAGNLSEAIVINFAVIKGVAA